MKSSMLYRSNLTKERMALLEELQNEAQEQESNLGVYKRPSREKELDVLWKNFKVNQRGDRSPGLYLAVGFIAGALCMFLMTALLSFGTNAVDNIGTTDGIAKKSKPMKFSIIPINRKAKDIDAATVPVESLQSYTVASGDTLEKIVIRFYGSYSPARVDKIVKTNKLASPDSLSIGQKLIIPMD